MKTTTPSSPRLSIYAGDPVIDGRLVPKGDGELPRDFGKRLVRFKEAADVTWDELADLLGVEPKQLIRWANGTEPSEGPTTPWCVSRPGYRAVSTSSWETTSWTPSRRTDHMPRKRVRRTKRTTHVLTGDFAKALEGFQEASGLTWAEIARRLGTSVVNLWRWRQGVQPNMHHLIALQDLADGMGLGHLLPRVRVRGR